MSSIFNNMLKREIVYFIIRNDSHNITYLLCDYGEYNINKTTIKKKASYLA